MTQHEDKVHIKQLAFSFNSDGNPSDSKIVKNSGTVQPFLSRELLSIRREAIERVRRDGIFPVHVLKK